MFQIPRILSAIVFLSVWAGFAPESFAGATRSRVWSGPTQIIAPQRQSQDFSDPSILTPSLKTPTQDPAKAYPEALRARELTTEQEVDRSKTLEQFHCPYCKKFNQLRGPNGKTDQEVLIETLCKHCKRFFQLIGANGKYSVFKCNDLSATILDPKFIRSLQEINEIAEEGSISKVPEFVTKFPSFRQTLRY